MSKRGTMELIAWKCCSIALYCSFCFFFTFVDFICCWILINFILFYSILTYSNEISIQSQRSALYLNNYVEDTTYINTIQSGRDDHSPIPLSFRRASIHRLAARVLVVGCPRPHANHRTHVTVPEWRQRFGVHEPSCGSFLTTRWPSRGKVNTRK